MKKRVNPAEDTFTLEREIDQLVCQLYGLTEKEMAIDKVRAESKK